MAPLLSSERGPCARAFIDESWDRQTETAFNVAVMGSEHSAQLPYKTTRSFLQSKHAGRFVEQENEVTIVTQASLDRLPRVIEQAVAWGGCGRGRACHEAPISTERAQRYVRSWLLFSSSDEDQHVMTDSPAARWVRLRRVLRQRRRGRS